MMTTKSCNMSGCVSTIIISSIHISTSCQQNLYNFMTSSMSCNPNGCYSVDRNNILINTSRKQYLHSLMIPIFSCNKDGCSTLSIPIRNQVMTLINWKTLKELNGFCHSISIA